MYRLPYKQVNSKIYRDGVLRSFKYNSEEQNIKIQSEEKMTVKEIIEKYLKDNKFDGLCNDECGCGNGPDCIAPCDLPLDCEPAYRHVCGENKPADCDMREDCYGECYKLTR